MSNKKVIPINNYNACFNMVGQLILDCLVPIYRNKSIKQVEKIKRERRNFANGKMLKLWCECSSKIKYDDLKKKIIEFNT